MFSMYSGKHVPVPCHVMYAEWQARSDYPVSVYSGA